MKKKSILFAIYFLVVICVIALFLTIHNLPLSDNIGSGATDNKGNDKNTNDITYVREIKLNCESEITAKFGTAIILKDDIISTEPADKIGEVRLSILDKDKNNTNDLTFENNTISSTKIGSYYIKFYAPTGSKTSVAVFLKINIVDSSVDDKIRCIKGELTENEEVNITDIFAIKNPNMTYDIEVFDSSVIQYSNGVFTGLKAGSSNIKVTLHTEYVDFVYNYTLFVKSKPVYNIELECADDITIKTKIYSIYYHITDINGDKVDQGVNVIISDPSIARVTYTISPTIKIEFLSKGSVTLTISSLIDANLSKTITITYQ